MPGKRYSQSKIDAALGAVVVHGTYAEAAKKTKVPMQTIHHWATVSHTQRLAELRERIGKELEDEAVDHWRRVVVDAAKSTSTAIEAVDQAITNGDSRDASAYSTAARNLATVGGIYSDHVLTYTGRPDRIVGRDGRDLDDVFRSLSALIPGVIINSTAEDVTHQNGQNGQTAANGRESEDKRPKQLAA